MNRKIISTVSALGLAAAVATAGAVPAGSAPAGATPADVARGEYLVKIMGCGDCHTPLTMTPEGPAPDASRALSGHPQELVVTAPPALGEGPWMWAGAATNTAYAGPWGVSFSSNLTPDPETGLGAWSEEHFVGAIRTGRHMGLARPILPPMPYPAYRNATDEDLRAIFAYLRSLPPVRNQVPRPIDPPAAS